MNETFPKINVDSLKSLFVKEIETRIISGKLKAGDKLPPERELAKMMGFSRSIVNSGILELASKNFVKTIPRQGTIVMDYNKEGTTAILTSLMNYSDGKLDQKIFQDLFDLRMLIEVESAQLAADNRTQENLEELKRLLQTIKKVQYSQVETYVDFNFAFHHQISLASDNMVFALTLKSFEPVCKNLIRMFCENKSLLPSSIEKHENLYAALVDRNKKEAGNIMRQILLQGKHKLSELLEK